MSKKFGVRVIEKYGNFLFMKLSAKVAHSELDSVVCITLALILVW
jgi:hypothetical protein